MITTAKEFLQRYRKAESRLFHLDEQLHLLRGKMEGITGLYGGDPVQGTHGGNKLQTLMEQYILREQAQESERARCAEDMSRVRRAVAAVEDAQARTLLEYRYLDGFDWTQIANLMRYTAEHVRRDMHAAALRAVQYPT